MSYSWEGFLWMMYCRFVLPLLLFGTSVTSPLSAKYLKEPSRASHSISLKNNAPSLGVKFVRKNSEEILFPAASCLSLEFIWHTTNAIPEFDPENMIWCKELVSGERPQPAARNWRPVGCVRMKTSLCPAVFLPVRVCSICCLCNVTVCSSE